MMVKLVKACFQTRLRLEGTLVAAGVSLDGRHRTIAVARSERIC
jgi:hypothetical protein